jgi:BASS family bile acid:Na+ symporter
VNLLFVLRVCAAIFMAGSLMVAGLAVTPRDVLVPLKHGRFVVLSLVFGWLVGPVLAILLLRVIPLDSSYATGLLLLSLAPCAPPAAARARMAGADPAYIAGFIVLSAVATVVVMLVAVPLMIDGLSANAWGILRPLLLLVLLPLMAGMWVKGRWAHTAARIVRPLDSITRLIGALLLLLVAILFGPSVIEAVGSYAIVAQVAFLSAMTVLSWTCAFGLSPQHKSVLTLGMSTRNLAAAGAPLLTGDHDPRVVVMLAITVPVMVVLSALARHWIGRHARPAVAELA